MHSMQRWDSCTQPFMSHCIVVNALHCSECNHATHQTRSAQTKIQKISRRDPVRLNMEKETYNWRRQDQLEHQQGQRSQVDLVQEAIWGNRSRGVPLPSSWPSSSSPSSPSKPEGTKIGTRQETKGGEANWQCQRAARGGSTSQPK